jgi:NDP-sugar pyrophosphorylase family protein
MIQIQMPIAGSAKPFHDIGQKFPKPLIEVLGHPMVSYAIASSRPEEDHRFIFIANAADRQAFYLDSVLKLLAPGCTIVQTDRPTGGALCTALLAVDHIERDKPLLVCNGDQWLAQGVQPALDYFRALDVDVGIITFKAMHPRWSFARTDESGMVVETAEKNPISSNATVGVYYYRTGDMFIRSAEKALLKNVRVNNQFFIVPSINQLILEGARVGQFRIPNGDFHPLGIPEDVASFLDQFQTSPLGQCPAD